MKIIEVNISNFRALEQVSVPLQQFSVLIGENDTGKTSFLYALEKFFANKRLSDPKDWYQREFDNPIRITVSFSNLPDEEALNKFKRSNGVIVVSKVFAFDTAPTSNAILDDNSSIAIPNTILNSHFSKESFHFIPVRRDLSVQFSMNKTALLGSLLRKKMKKAVEEAGAAKNIDAVQTVLRTSIDAPRKSMELFLKEQLNNETISLGFDDLIIDPTEGVSFKVTLSDDRVSGIEIQDRGAGTQNNLIIALFRLIAEANLDGQFIFAMEEPENSLHPKAQRQLLNVIQEISESIQVIVTTHSPVFIDRSKYESNILLTRKTNGNTVAKVFDSSDISEIRTDLGIQASDALLKGGGNCALLVEGKTEENGFPIFMEMLNLSEFELGIAIIKMEGSDPVKTTGVVKLLERYDIPCIVVIDNDAEKTETELNNRLKNNTLNNLRHVYRLTRGTIEDYYPPSIMADVLNKEFNPKIPFTPKDLESGKSGKERLKEIKKVMYERGVGDSIEYFKSALGSVGTRLMKEQGLDVDPEIEAILKTLETVAREN